MEGRFLRVKKTTLLKIFAGLAFLGFLAFIFISIFFFKTPSLWFFGFCLLLGCFEIIKSTLFKLDSALYLGTLLVGIGSLGLFFHFTNTAQYAPFYIALAFIIASLITFLFCGQKFHLIIVFSIIFVSLYCFLYVKNLINIPILIAFTLPFLLLLITEMLIVCFHKK